MKANQPRIDLLAPTARRWLLDQFAAAIPSNQDLSVSDWGERYVRLVGSAKSETFRKVLSPWIVEPLDRTDDGVTRMVTFRKPVQAGGSVVGEIALCRWLAIHNVGDIQYNWEDDRKADDRWQKRIEKILKKCKPVVKRWPTTTRDKTGLLVLPHCNLTVQGVFTTSNVDSDSIRFQINEEIHNWKPGRLKQAFGRTTRFWNSVTINISNAGVVNDQLDESYNSGTQQHWEVRCPGCGQFHVMRTRWEKDHPELGGLRYESDGCRRGDEYDYNKLVPTIRYQMPCGYLVRDTPNERRLVSLSARYGEPTNKGALLANRSYTLDAVSVDDIPWVQLIQEKHEALRALKYGDPEPWKRYLQQRECRNWDPEDRPIVGKVVLSSTIKKNREGLPDRAARFFALDRQQGEMVKGEFPHWWLVIRDFMQNGDSRLVWEGKCLTDDDAIGTIREHGCTMHFGVADSGDDTTHVYQFCLRHGINAIKGSGEAFFIHDLEEDKRLRPDPREPMFWHYSKGGIRDRLHWLRSSGEVKWEVPSDVSGDYKSHMESEELQSGPVGRTKEVVSFWKQLKRRNDLFVCECYNAMQAEMAGLIGERQLIATKQEKKDSPNGRPKTTRRIFSVEQPLHAMRGMPPIYPYVRR